MHTYTRYNLAHMHTLAHFVCRIAQSGAGLTFALCMSLHPLNAVKTSRIHIIRCVVTFERKDGIQTASWSADGRLLEKTFARERPAVEWILLICLSVFTRLRRKTIAVSFRSILYQSSPPICDIGIFTQTTILNSIRHHYLQRSRLQPDAMRCRISIIDQIIIEPRYLSSAFNWKTLHGSIRGRTEICMLYDENNALDIGLSGVMMLCVIMPYHGSMSEYDDFQYAYHIDTFISVDTRYLLLV